MRHEDEIDVYPVVRVHVERVGGEGVSNVEDVSVHVLCCFSRQVSGEHVSRGVEQDVAEPAEETGEEQVLVHGGGDGV